MASTEPFTFVETTKDISKEGYGDYVDILSAKVADVDIQFCSRLRSQYPELIVTTVPAGNLDLILFADLGYASYELDIEQDYVSRWRGYIPPPERDDKAKGYLGEVINYAKYNYKFGDEYFLVYYLKFGYTSLQYILKEPRGNSETPNTTSALTDKLLRSAGEVLYQKSPGIYVFDNYWTKDRKLYDEVQKASWDKVILDPKMKDNLISVSDKFFDSKDIYADLGVPWKRGLLFHGPPGNGKTISIKALMHTLSRRPSPVPTLYVRAAPGTYYIRNVFAFARIMSPCLLVLEDVETIVNSATRSYFFNEVDGLDNNDGILMVASTNFLERLDPGLSKRPSRFDRKYLFPLPNEHERTLYAEFWREKLRHNDKIEFPHKLCPAIAHITDKFSFAYMQEAFVATLLAMARDGSDDDFTIAGLAIDSDLDQYLLWRVLKEQVEILREDMDKTNESGDVNLSDFMALPSLQPMRDSAQSLPMPRPFCDGNSLGFSIEKPLPMSMLETKAHDAAQVRLEASPGVDFRFMEAKGLT